MRSLVVVLPDEPVRPTTVSSGSRSTTARASRPIAAQRVVDDAPSARRSTARVPSTATAPAATAVGGEVVPVDLLAGERDEQAARARPCASRTRPGR